jgi:hypothetical protein
MFLTKLTNTVIVEANSASATDTVIRHNESLLQFKSVDHDKHFNKIIKKKDIQ